MQLANAEADAVTQAGPSTGGILFYSGWGGDRKIVMKDKAIASISGAREKIPAEVGSDFDLSAAELAEIYALVQRGRARLR